MARNKFELRSCASGPFKMMGATKASPKKLYSGYTLDNTGGEYTNVAGGGKGALSGSLGGNLQFGNVNLGGKYTNKYGEGKSTSLTGGVFFEPYSSRFKRDYEASFYGKASGEYGLSGQRKGKGFGRLDLGFTRPGKQSGCVGYQCHAGYTGYDIGAFGQTGAGGTKAGLSGRYGLLSGDAAYNFSTGKPEYKLGLTIPFAGQKIKTRRQF